MKKNSLRYSCIFISSLILILIMMSNQQNVFAVTPPQNGAVPKPSNFIIYLPWNGTGHLGGCGYNDTHGLCKHTGINAYALDFNPDVQGGPIFSVAPGIVVFAHGSCPDSDKDCLEGYGNTVIVRHEIGDAYYYYSQYSHLESVNVYENQDIELDQIGIEGQTGNASSIHLHFVLVRCDKSWDIRSSQTKFVNFSGCQPVVPEPFVGVHVYEGFGWWNRLSNGINMISYRPSNYGDDKLGPQGNWLDKATLDKAEITPSNPIKFYINYFDPPPGYYVGEIRLTMWVKDWYTGEFTDLDPDKVWKIVARCDPRRGPCGNGEWRYVWDPYTNSGYSVDAQGNKLTDNNLLQTPWLPKGIPFSPKDANPLKACFSFDLFDIYGNPQYSPGGTGGTGCSYFDLQSASINSETTEANDDAARSILIMPGSITVNNDDNATFVSDVTVPDGMMFSAGQVFTKTWRIKNSGKSTWGSGYQLVFNSGEQMGAPKEVLVPITSPGQVVDLNVNMVAPSIPGVYTGYWQLRNPQKTFFGDKVWARIKVLDQNSGEGHISVFDISPTSPSSANQVHIVGRIKSFPDFRSMRFAIGNEYYEMPNIRQVGDQLEISMDWQTGALPRGNYAIVFEIANNGDLSWTNPERRVITYALEGIPVAQNHAPDRPVQKSPYNWYLKDASGSPASVDICVNPSSDPDGDEVQYLYEVKDQGGGVYANSGWTGSTCWSHSYDPNTYSWRVKTWDGSAESDWSTDIWNFTVAKGGVYIGDITFYNVNTNDTHICVPVTYDGIQGPDVYAWLNKAPDNTETGEWRLLDHYGPNAGPDCNQPNVHGFWIRSPEYETGSHQLKVTAVKIDSGANQTKNTTYTIPFIRPSDVKILTPSTLTNNGTWWNTGSIDFQWSPSLRVENYTLRVSTNSNPWDDLNPIIDVSLLGNQTAYSQTFNQDYPHLYWSVRASNSEGAADSGPDTWFGIDQVAPTCQVQPLPAVSYENVFQVNFAGTDDSSGISTFDVQYKDSERDEWKDWISNQSASRPYELFIGQPGHTYYFRCRAKDLAGNTPSDFPTAPDTWIKVDPQSRPVEPWFDNGYSMKRNLTIQNNMAGIELPAGYPVSLHFTSGTSPTADEIYNASQSTPKCNDIRVVFNNTTDLPRVIDTCTASDIKLWFRIQGPIPEGGIDNINYQLYYGNSSPAGLVGGRVFYPDIDGNSLRVYDMREGTGSTLHDAAGHGDAVMSSALGWAQGKWGPAVQFPTDEGPTPRPAIDDGSSYMPTNSFTIELWLKRGPVDGGTIAHQAVQYYQPRWFVSIVDNRLSLKVWPAVGSGVSEVRSARYLGESTFYTQFHHFAITFDGINKVRFYIDGQLDSERTLTQSGLVPSSSPLRIGASDINTARLSGVMFGFSLSEGVRTNFPEGSFAFITTEPSVLAGQIINPPSSGSPDLVVQSLTTYPYPGGGILVEALVLNQGNMSTQNGFYTDLYLDHLPTGSGDYAGSLRFWVNDPIDPNETAILTTVISDLQGIAGKSSFVTSSYTETSGVIYAQADSSGALMEQDKTNNIYFEGVEICIASPDLDEDDDESSTATPLQIGLSLTHNFDSPSDLDWIKFSAQAGNYYRIFTSDLGLSSDTYLYLYGSDGETLLLSNDDYGSTLASQIRWLAPADGDYYILVQHWNPNAAGCGTGYTISIDEIPEYYLYFPLILH